MKVEDRRCCAASAAPRFLHFAALFLAMGWFSVFGLDRVSAQDFHTDFMTLSREAEGARKAIDLESVEQARTKRLELVKKAAEAKEDSPIVMGYQAIKRVDGSFKESGLIDQLKYNEAIVLLRDAWNVMVKQAPHGPVFGEVACRLFEAVHQRKAFYPPLDEDEPVISDEELVDILETAERLDPCCVAAIPMIAWIKPLDIKESFLRAEVRPSLKRRQKQLLDISHPLFWSLNNPADVKNADKPVLPWHAPAELAKARSLQMLLDESDTLDPILQNWFQPSSNCMVPRTPLLGHDAAGNMAELLYGRMLITSTADKKGRRRSAAFLCNRKSEWSKYFVELLWREPTDAELKDDGRLATLKRLIDQLETVAAWEMKGTTFRLCSWPVHDTDVLLREGVRLLCVKDSLRFPKIRYTESSNDVTAVRDELQQGGVTSGDPIRSDPVLFEKIEEVAQSGDKTRNPLLELTEFVNPIALVTFDGRRDSPAFFEQQGQLPFLKLNDGTRINFLLKGPRAPCAERVTPFGTLVMPLHFVAVPEPIIAGSGLGQCMKRVLQQANFTSSEASQAISEFFASNGVEVPDKFRRWVMVKAEAKWENPNNKTKDGRRVAKPSRQDFQREVQQVLDELTSAARAEVLGIPQNFQRIFGSKTVVPAVDTFKDEFMYVDQIYGFRYFVDPRENLIVSANVGTASYFLNPTKETSSSSPVFKFIDPRGEEIPAKQFYSVNEYRQLKKNIYEEHLAKAMLFAPSFGTYTAILDDQTRPFLAPDDRMPKYFRMSGNESSAESNNVGTQAIAGDVVNKFPRLEQPIAAWDLNGGKDQIITLTNIHNEYVSLFGAVGSRFSELSDLLIQAKKDDVNQNDALSPLGKRARGLLSLQIQSARGHSRARNYHHAIVFYNDLLRVLRPRSLTAPFSALLDQVPTTAQSTQFVSDLRNQLSETGLALVLQTELAGTLLRAGRPDSAYALLSRTVVDFERLIEPSLKMLEELLQSYGVVLPPNHRQTLAELENLVQDIKRLLRQHDIAIAWRKVPVASVEEIAPAVERIRQIAELLEETEKFVNKKVSPEDSQKLQELLRADSQQAPTDFRFWLERKKILANCPRVSGRLPAGASYDVRVAIPRLFEEESGFEDRDIAAERLVDAASCEGVIKWCELEWDAAMAAKDAAANAFLIAWFWMDQSDNARTREALIKLGAIFDRQVEVVGEESLAGLVARINSFRVYSCANCFSQSYPGACSSRVDFTDSLTIQVLLWERAWGARALNPSFAAKQAADVYRMIADAGASALKAVETVSGRYFFPDYRFVYGSIPEFVVKDVLENNGRLNMMIRAGADKAEIAAGAGNQGIPMARREDDEWPIVTAELAEKYFEELPLLEGLDGKVLGF